MGFMKEIVLMKKIKKEYSGDNREYSKMDEKILTVSVAAYNVQDTLKEALLPFSGENIRDRIEVLIVNDGSADTTASVAEEFVRDYPQTYRLINKENGGWGSTLNVGIREAQGKYFKQLDGDDYYIKENLPEFLRCLEQTEADMVYTPYVNFDHNTGERFETTGSKNSSNIRFPLNKVLPVTDGQCFVPAMHCVTVKTEVLKKNGISITEHCFYTDVEYVIKSLNCSDTITFFDIPVYSYRMARSGQSMSIEGIRKHYKEHQKMLFAVLQYYEKDIPDIEKRNLVRQRIADLCGMQYFMYFALECNKNQKKELIDYDARLKSQFPSFYELIEIRQVIALRICNFWGYKIAARQKMNKDKRLKRVFFERI